jgi:IclR family acetate operon transcriptional repressor
LVERRSVISKVAAILRTLGVGGALTVTEIADMTGLPLSTAHRLVVELADWQLLSRGVDGRYGLVESATRRADPAAVDIRFTAGPIVEDLSGVTRRDVRVGVLDGFRVLYAEKTYGHRPLSNFSSAATLPAHATALGQVLLAFSSGDVVRSAIGQGLRRYTCSTLTTAARLDNVLRQVRLRRLAIVSGELVRGHFAVAAPVFGGRGDIAAAIEVRLRDGRAELATVVPALTVAVRGLSRELAHLARTGDAELSRPVATVLAMDGWIGRRRREDEAEAFLSPVPTSREV